MALKEKNSNEEPSGGEMLIQIGLPHLLRISHIPNRLVVYLQIDQSTNSMESRIPTRHDHEIP